MGPSHAVCASGRTQPSLGACPHVCPNSKWPASVVHLEEVEGRALAGDPRRGSTGPQGAIFLDRGGKYKPLFYIREEHSSYYNHFDFSFQIFHCVTMPRALHCFQKEVQVVSISFFAFSLFAPFILILPYMAGGHHK